MFALQSQTCFGQSVYAKRRAPSPRRRDVRIYPLLQSISYRRCENRTLKTTEFLFESGAKEVHIRPACPPLIYGCKYLNFSRSRSDLDLITRQVIEEREGEVTEEILQDYADTESQNYSEMVDCICKKMNFTSLAFNRLDDMMKAVGIEPCKLCTYCWNGKEGNK